MCRADLAHQLVRPMGRRAGQGVHQANRSRTGRRYRAGARTRQLDQHADSPLSPAKEEDRVMTEIGYDDPLYILPFDHRFPYAAEVFGFAKSLDPRTDCRGRCDQASDLRGLLQGPRRRRASRSRAAILVDERFGRGNSARCQTPAGPTDDPAHRDERPQRIRLSTMATIGPTMSKSSGRRLSKCWCISIPQGAVRNAAARAAQSVSDVLPHRRAAIHVRVDRAAGGGATGGAGRRPRQVRLRVAAGFDGPRPSSGFRTWASSPTYGRSRGSTRREDCRRVARRRVPRRPRRRGLRGAWPGRKRSPGPPLAANGRLHAGFHRLCGWPVDLCCPASCLAGRRVERREAAVKEEIARRFCRLVETSSKSRVA